MATKKKKTVSKKTTGKKKVVVKKPVKRKTVDDATNELAAHLAKLVSRVETLTRRLGMIELVRTELASHLSKGAMTGEERRLAQHILNISLGVDVATSSASVYGGVDSESIADLIEESPAVAPENEVVDLSTVSDTLLDKDDGGSLIKEEKTTTLSVGDRVKATMRIAFADFGKDEHIHAEEGDEGAVEHIEMDKDVPVVTVRFDDSGTATIVSDEEIVKL